MKKILFFVSLSLAVLSITSCNRSWTCECQTGNGVVPIELNSLNKNEAKDACEKYALDQYSKTGGCKLR